MRLVAAILSVAVLTGCATSTALARDLTALSTTQLAKYQKNELHHSSTTVRFWRNHPRLYAAHWRFASQNAYFHRQRIKWLGKEYRETLAKLVPPVRMLSAWTCIHGYEGAWNSNTGNGYYGGLQMDYSFMHSYGRELLRTKGTADNWTPQEQMMVAEIAYSKRGFTPWPKTARMCGLL